MKRVNDLGTDMLFVALGSPRQEKWINRYRDRLEAPLLMGVGGSFDVVARLAPRAPKVFRVIGMEFLYRLIKEPKRLKRQACYPLFMAEVFRERLFHGER